MSEHIGTKFPTKEAVLEYLRRMRPEWDTARIEEAYQEQQRGLTISLSASCRFHGSFKYPAYDEEGYHQYHTIPQCPDCKLAKEQMSLNGAGI
jgi:hypothetical protein